MSQAVKTNIKKFFLKYRIFFVLIFIILILLSVFIYFWNKPSDINKDFKSINLDNINYLMIVAHPDDELLWGGGHLIEDNYLVVCITCGNNKIRNNEFKKVMNSTKDKYIMLGYPDKTNGTRDNWMSVKTDIMEDLEEILNLKDWKIVVTHNPEGEYGHQHHKMTSEFVTYLYDNKNNLYYFGHYYSKKNIAAHQSDMSSINEEILEKKINLIGLYKSQKFIQTSFDYMYEHEDWESYNEWMSDFNEKNE